MSDLEYSASLDTSNIDKGLKRIKDSADQTTQVFSRLKSVLGALAVGAVVRNAFELANAMRDMASATDLALGTVVGFSQAIAANGGTLDRARDGLSDFVKNLGEAQNGSTELQKAFGDLGISLTEVQTLSEEDLLRRTLEGLTGVESTAQRSAVAMRLFGESMKGVDINTVSNDLQEYIRANQGLSEAVDAAGRANQNFKNAFAEFQIQLLAALEPLSQLAAALLENKEAVRSFIETAINLGKVIAALFVIKKLGTIVRDLGLAFGYAKNGTILMSGSLGQFRQGMSDVIKTATVFRSQLGFIARDSKITMATLQAFGKRIGFLATGFLRMLPIVGQVLLAFEILRGIYNYFADDTEAVVEAQENLADSMEETVSAAERLRIAQEELAATELKTAQAALDSYRKTREQFLERYQYQTSLINLSDEQRLRVEALHEAEQNYLQAIAPLQTRLNELKAQEEEVNALAIAAIEEKIAAIRAEYDASIPAIEAAVAARIAENAELERATELLRLKEEAQRNLETATQRALDYQRELTSSTEAMAREFDSLHLDPLQRQLQNIEVTLRDRLANQVRSLQALMNEYNSDEIQAQIDRITAATESAIQNQKELAQKSYEYQRSFAYGWRRAFEEYRDSAFDNARRAEEVFSKVTKGMEDSIVNFAKTGKFQIKDFVADVLETLLRSQIQNVIAGIFNIPQPGSGFGGFGGGQQQQYQPQQQQRSGGGLGILDTISSLWQGAKSIFNSFAGLFADGGMIPAGKFGIVGERGPEFISGPAQITPMGTSVVNYNINAVDALSFRQMIARDPGFIHAVASKGASTLAGRR